MMDRTEYDRGAFTELSFQRCARGFTLHTVGYQTGMLGQTYAFDRIEDLAAWLVEQYREGPNACAHASTVGNGAGYVSCVDCGSTLSAG